MKIAGSRTISRKALRLVVQVRVVYDFQRQRHVNSTRNVIGANTGGGRYIDRIN